MISLIICSRTNVLPEIFTQNVSDTIGCSYELIVIDNSQNQYSIFEAYNLGIQKSKGEILCFVHDDVLFHTKEWGAVLELEFKDNPDFSLIGIAGSKVKTKFPTGWWDCEDQYKVLNIIQRDKDQINHQNFGFNKRDLQKVLFIDGVFMALKKNQNFLFDTDLKGFHNYDLNLCVKIRENGGNIGVTNKILFEHLSIGNLNRDWFISTVVFHEKYFKSLTINNSSPDQEIFAGKRFIDYTIRILGKKKGMIYLLSVFRFTNSLKVKYTLGKYIINNFF